MDGLKEGDYLVAVGDTDCKWMGVSDVMKLLKDVDEEGIDIKVISMMDNSIQAMVTFSTSWSLENIVVFPEKVLGSESKMVQSCLLHTVLWFRFLQHSLYECHMKQFLTSPEAEYPKTQVTNHHRNGTSMSIYSFFNICQFSEKRLLHCTLPCHWGGAFCIINMYLSPGHSVP